MTENLINTYIIKDGTEFSAENIRLRIGSSEPKKLSEYLSNEPDRVVKDLTRSLKKIGNGQNIIKLSNDKIDDTESKDTGLLTNFMGKPYSGKYIGLITDKSSKDEKIGHTYFFHSRFDKLDEFHFTNYILSRALNINSRIFPDMRIHSGSASLLQPLLALMFAEQIRTAYKHGIFRCYRNFEENDSHVRGRIQVERHIRLNPIFNGKIAYTHREYTADNAVNRIILTAYDQLCRRNGTFMRNLLSNSQYREVKSFFSQLKNITAPAAGQEIHQLLKKNKQKIHHSVYRDWEAVRKTAIQILHHMGIQTYDSGRTQINGILIDMTHIWESYLEEIMGSHSLSFKTQYQKNILNGHRGLKPDFLNREKRIVMDAKYKNLWEKIARESSDSWEYARDDIFQLLSYMYVFDCDTGVILCPLPSENKHKAAPYPLVSDNDAEYAHLKGKKMYVLPLIIPTASDKSYEEFTELMKKSEESFCKALKEIIETAEKETARQDPPSQK